MINKDTPRTKERRVVAEKRLSYLERKSKSPPNEELVSMEEVVSIPRHSPDSLVEVRAPNL